MSFDWDAAKSDRNLAQRGFDFEFATQLFATTYVEFDDTRRDYGEPRFQTVGFLSDRMVMVVWTPRNDARHVISMRKCNDREKAIYQERFGQG